MPIAVASTAIDSWNSTTSPKTGSVTVANGDLLVILCSARSQSAAFSASGGSLTYTNRTSQNAQNGPATAIITAPSASGQTFTLSVTRSGNTFAWGCICLRCTGVQSVGAVNSGASLVSGTEQISLTTTAANAAIACMLNDSGTGTAPTWVTTDAGTFTIQGTTGSQSNYSGIYLSAGGIATKTIGVSTPNGFAWSMSAVELIPIPGVPSRPLIVNKALRRATRY